MSGETNRLECKKSLAIQAYLELYRWRKKYGSVKKLAKDAGLTTVQIEYAAKKEIMEGATNAS